VGSRSPFPGVLFATEGFWDCEYLQTASVAPPPRFALSLFATAKLRFSSPFPPPLDHPGPFDRQSRLSATGDWFLPPLICRHRSSSFPPLWESILSYLFVLPSPVLQWSPPPVMTRWSSSLRGVSEVLNPFYPAFSPWPASDPSATGSGPSRGVSLAPTPEKAGFLRILFLYCPLVPF